MQECRVMRASGTEPKLPSHPRGPAVWFFVASLALSALVVWPLAVPLSVGAVLAYVSERPIDGALRRLGKQDRALWRWAVAIGFVLAVSVVLLVPLGFALYVAARDLSRLIASKEPDEWIRISYRGLEWASAKLAAHGIDLAPEELTTRARAFVASHAGKVGAFVGDILTAAPDALFDGSVALLAWIFLAVEGKGARDRLLARLLPWPRERETLRAITAEVIQSTIVSNVIVSFVQAMLVSILLVVFRVPRAFVWGVLTFFLSFVPVVGTMPVTLGAAAWLASQGRSGAAIGMLVVAVAAGAVDNVLRPLFMKSSVDLSFLWLLVALVGGVGLFGLAGVILGPLAFSLLVASLRTLEALDAPAAADAAAAVEPGETRVDTGTG